MARGAVGGGRESVGVTCSSGEGGGDWEVGATVRCENPGKGTLTSGGGDGDDEHGTSRCRGTPTVAKKVPNTSGSTDRLASSVEMATVNCVREPSFEESGR
jgi:hypothetical protein